MSKKQKAHLLVSLGFTREGHLWNFKPYGWAGLQLDSAVHLGISGMLRGDPHLQVA